MKIIIVGAGMYVTGRNNSGTGTILASLFETSKEVVIDNITVVSQRPQSIKDVKEAEQRINQFLHTEVDVKYLSLGKDEPLNSYAKILEEGGFDTCIISTPDHLHFPYAKVSIEHGLHCMVVKPLTPTLSEAQELVRLQDEYKVYGAVEFHKRWDETNMYIRRRIKEGALGKLLYAVVDYSQRINVPTELFKGWVDKTNIFQYLGVHYVDLIYFLSGYLPDRLMAYGTRGALAARGFNAYDSIHVNVIWKNPAHPADELIVSYNTNWIDPLITTAMSDQKYKVIGTVGRIECDQKNRGLEEVIQPEGVRAINPYFSEYLTTGDGAYQFQGYGHKSINTFIKDVLDLLAKRTSINELEGQRPTFRSSLISTAVIEAVNRSLSNNSEWIKINL